MLRPLQLLRRDDLTIFKLSSRSDTVVKAACQGRPHEYAHGSARRYHPEASTGKCQRRCSSPFEGALKANQQSATIPYVDTYYDDTYRPPTEPSALFQEN
ncbi:unnamed protein product [Heligmosomoides polygyrus]|uniref:NADH-ubiquinone oxidoreductase 9 kDa subunit n=1 Tax=Heligmosomoides polygyrus TaxID=6339 RepID=A0A183GGL1_HELPZ|nr:unnamed protein product [Heligmosomoides polygyrus]